MPTIEDFEKEFAPKLAKTRRWEGFYFIAETLLSAKGPINIIETGCAREKDNWAGDGQSTIVWNWLANQTLGVTVSVDIDPKATRYAESLGLKATRFVLNDSVSVLRTEYVKFLNLLYLDSLDFDPKNPHVSAMHHACELTACWDRLPSGCLIAVDDCHDVHLGKHHMVRALMDRMEIRPLLCSYITIWRKP